MNETFKPAIEQVNLTEARESRERMSARNPSGNRPWVDIITPFSRRASSVARSRWQLIPASTVSHWPLEIAVGPRRRTERLSFTEVKAGG